VARAESDVQWRANYNVARKEAQEKNLPLVIDFGTDNCPWCVKLDGSTLRDPRVVGTMNQHFVSLKVNARENPSLAEALNIQSYPTLVLAAPDGKILETLEGYKEAAVFHESLQRALALVGEPEWMTRDYAEATKAIAGSDYARALTLLKAVAEDGKVRPVQVKSRQLLQDLEQQAATLLARAKQMEDKGQTAQALEVLAELQKSFPGTQAASDGVARRTVLANKPEPKVDPRVRRARELLAQAREAFRSQQFLCCLDHCDILSGTFADLPEGVEASQLAAEVKNNPEWMRLACESLSDRLGQLYMSMAETWLKKGQPQQAVLCLERVIQGFPGTRQAEAAQTRLAQVQGRPNQMATFESKAEKK
jgi:thioredoxin-like negative regulator of GroEL